MDPNSGKLFGAVGKAGSGETASAAGSTAADAVVLSWYTLKWLERQGFGASDRGDDTAASGAPAAANAAPSCR